jgi:hypothetical protein
MIGHVPEIGGHDAETVGHALPKYAAARRFIAPFRAAPETTISTRQTLGLCPQFTHSTS